MARPDLLAAVDLGSNSFHLQIGRVVEGQIYPLDALREPVRLGAGLTADKRLDRATQARALETLERFGERLRGWPREAVRAVGTNTLRVARNAPQFLRDARAALGFPIEVIAGLEEARLIYLGVAHSMPPATHRRLVVDIGGGSTEFIVGIGFEPKLTESLYMGCVSWSLRFFADGRIDKPRMKKAELAARQELATMANTYRSAGWQEAVASSGTARSLEAILRENGYAEEGITREGLDRLRALLIKHERADPDRIAGLSENRVPVLPGGVAIMRAVLGELAIERMAVSEGALRHGVLYDLLGRVEHRDMRAATVTQFVRRYHVDAAQAGRVQALALAIYDALAASGRGAQLRETNERADDPDRMMLGWAAQLAEAGLSVAHAQYHKHSAYILSNADMPGFSRMEQQRLARIVLAHRGKLGKVQDAELDGSDWALVFALRLASLALRSRTDAPFPLLRVAGDEAGFLVELPQAWLDENPLTAAALETERDLWRAIGMRFAVGGLSEKRAAQLGRV
jgi:exopolyphosphatase/guanosine-5'-triphosphate,3'-diphosphate pyrophosphatase